MSEPPASFCWFDYETFGISPRWDRPAQFAAIQTDSEPNPIGQSIMFYCRQSDDYLPHPSACRVTGQSPQEVNSAGRPENRFIADVQAELGAPGTCSVGYNSVRFDDEFTRHTLFRNLRDPYEHEWKHGASRWDLLDVVRLTRALRPDGIVWPMRDDGSPSNRLEDLSAANSLDGGQAHDALVDVRATIALARLIRDRQPRLFAHALAHRDKRSIASLLDPCTRTERLLISPFIPASRHHLAVVMPLCPHPERSNSVIVLDLDTDPRAVMELDTDALAAPHSGLHVVALNKCPVVAPVSVLRSGDAERLGMDRDTLRQRAEACCELFEPRWQATCRTAFSRAWPDDGNDDVDGSLYSGAFLSPVDRERLTRVIANKGACQPAPTFSDSRLEEMVFRYRARNHFQTLDDEERKRWYDHVRHRLLSDESAPWLGLHAFNQAMKEQDWRDDQRLLRRDLEAYAHELAAAYDISMPDG